MQTRTEFLNRFSPGKDRVLAAHLLDLYERTERRNVMTSSKFLNPTELQLADAVLEQCGFPEHILTGGYDGAERRVIAFLPSYLHAGLPPEELPIGAVRAGWGRENKAAHRDVLGSLMSLGIEREAVGDILVTDTGCDIVLVKEVLPFIRENWDSIGRFHIHPEEIPLAALVPAASDETVLQDTVAALRLDAVIGAGFSMGRNRAHELVCSGKVTKNGRQTIKPDAQLSQGDVITARGFGKLVLETVGPLSKKKRICITLRKFG